MKGIGKLEQKKTAIQKVISIIFFLCILTFFILYVCQLDYSKLLAVEINPVYLLLSLLLGLLTRFYGAFVWLQILKGLGAKIKKFIPLNYVYAKSWLGRYIPGKVTWILGKVYFASQHGISKRKLAVSSLFEGVLQVLVAFLYGSILLLFTNGLGVFDYRTRLFLLMFCLVMAFFLLPPVFNSVIKITFRLLKKRDLGDEHLISGKILFKTIIFFIVATTISGVSYFFMARSIYDIPYSSLPYLIGMLNVAGAAGIASLIAPSGFGVREGIQILLLNVILPKEIVLVVVVFARVWDILLDVLFYFVSLVLTKK